MPKIVGKDQSVYKRITCKNCASIIEYVPNEVKTIHSKDYTGGSDVKKVIGCPECHREVIISVQ